MKLSEVIAKLEEARDKYGDRELMSYHLYDQKWMPTDININGPIDDDEQPEVNGMCSFMDTVAFRDYHAMYAKWDEKCHNMEMDFNKKTEELQKRCDIMASTVEDIATALHNAVSHGEGKV